MEHERKIKKNIINLKKDMDAKDLVDYMISEEIFDFDDNEKINGYNPNTASNRNNAFFTLLFGSGDRAYTVFLGALARNGQRHLAEMIENTVLVGGEGDQAGESWIQLKSEKIRHLKKILQLILNVNSTHVWCYHTVHSLPEVLQVLEYRGNGIFQWRHLLTPPSARFSQKQNVRNELFLAK